MEGGGKQSGISQKSHEQEVAPFHCLSLPLASMMRTLFADPACCLNSSLIIGLSTLCGSIDWPV